MYISKCCRASVTGVEPTKIGGFSIVEPPGCTKCKDRCDIINIPLASNAMLDVCSVKEWWLDAKYWEDNESPRIEDIVTEAEKRILEKAIDRMCEVSASTNTYDSSIDQGIEVCEKMIAELKSMIK